MRLSRTIIMFFSILNLVFQINSFCFSQTLVPKAVALDNEFYIYPTYAIALVPNTCGTHLLSSSEVSMLKRSYYKVQAYQRIEPKFNPNFTLGFSYGMTFSNNIQMATPIITSLNLSKPIFETADCFDLYSSSTIPKSLHLNLFFDGQNKISVQKESFILRSDSSNELLIWIGAGLWIGNLILEAVFLNPAKRSLNDSPEGKVKIEISQIQK